MKIKRQQNNNKQNKTKKNTEINNLKKIKSSDYKKKYIY